MTSPHPSSSPPDTPLSLDITGLIPSEADTKLDAEISHHDHDHDLRSSLPNTILELPPTAIATLPNELILEIFMHCHDPDVETVMNHSFDGVSLVGSPHSSSPSGTTPERKESQRNVGRQRLTLSWVSRLWRSLALSLQPLWSFITDGQIEYARECTARSGNLHLSVYLNRPYDELLITCLGQSCRLARFHANLYLIVEIGYSEAWTQEAPHLVSLYLRGFIDDSIYQTQRDKKPLFGGHHRLRSLTLGKCFLGENLSLRDASTITSLNLYHIPMKGVPDGLSSMKGLMYLTISDCRDYSGLEYNGSGRAHTVMLPSLLTLAIEEVGECEEWVFLFLHQLDTRRASIHLTLRCYSSSHSHYLPYGPNNAEARIEDTFQLLEYFRQRSPFWGVQATHDISIRETEKEFSLTLSNPHFSPKLTLCLEHAGVIYNHLASDYGYSRVITRLAVRFFPFFKEDLGIASMTQNSEGAGLDVHQLLSDEIVRVQNAHLLWEEKEGSDRDTGDSEDSEDDLDSVDELDSEETGLWQNYFL